MITESDVARWRRRSVLFLSPLVVARFIAGWALLTLAVAPFFHFPVIGSWGAVAALAYLGLLFLVPRAWLYVLPVATVCLDLSPLTGRSLYSGLDLLVLVTVAAGLMFNRYRISVLRPTPTIVCIEVFLLCAVIGFTAWNSFLAPPGVQQGFPWISEHFSYRSLKGLLWGLLLVPLFGHAIQRNKRGSTRDLVSGCIVAATILAGTMIIEYLGAYASLGRIAGEYSPTVRYLATAFLADSRLTPETPGALCLLLAPGLLYAALRFHASSSVLAIAVIAALALLLSIGGAAAPLFALATATSAYLCLEAIQLARGQNQQPRRQLRALVPWLFAALAAYGIALSIGGEWGVVVALVLVAVVWHFIAPGDASTGDVRARLVATSILLWPLLLTLAAGAAVATWQGDNAAPVMRTASIIRSAGGAALSPLFGHGVGTLPRRHGNATPGPHLAPGPGKTLLVLPPANPRFGQALLGQRAAVTPGREYTLIVRARSNQPAEISVSLCEASIRLLTEMLASCPTARVALATKSDTYQRLKLTLASGAVGDAPSLLRLPTLLLIQNTHATATVELDSIALTDGGNNLLRNSSFTEGLDHWFHYLIAAPAIGMDGNLYRNLYLESGALAVLLLCTLVGLSLYNAAQPRAPDSLSAVYAAASLGVFLLGLFCDPLLSPRVEWLFYFMLFASLVSLRVPRPQASVPGA